MPGYAKKEGVGLAPPSHTMASAPLPSFDLVDRALRELGATEGAPQAHGSLCGIACVLGYRARSVWIAGLTVAGDSSAVRAEPAGILGDLAAVTCTALSEGDMGFSPLLPPDDLPLSCRAEGLAEWCAGFMHGLGEAVGTQDAGEALSGDVTREIMEDLGRIARVTVDDDETDLEAEAAYTELVEFVRVSVQLVFDELYDVRQDLTALGVH
jgi:uncharacterized protein YgfB (UPF0149 family)